MTRRTAIACKVHGEPDPLAWDIVLHVGPGCTDFNAQLSGQGEIIRAFFKLGNPQRRAIELWNAIQSGKCTEQRAGNRMQNIASACLDVLACNSVEITWYFPDDLPPGAQLVWEKKKKPAKKKKARSKK